MYEAILAENDDSHLK